LSNITVDGKPAKTKWWLSGNGEVASYLKNTYGIDAKIYGGYTPGAGGWLEEGNANVYKLNGKQISHQQILDIIKASKG